MILSGKFVVISGGARIGAVVGEELAKRGCDIILTYRSSRQAAENAAEKIRRNGRRSEAIQADISQEKDVKRLFVKIKNKYSHVDVLVNMASIYENVPLSKVTTKDMQLSWDAHVKTSWLMTKYGCPLFPKGKGHIINFADWVVTSGRPRYKNFLPYYTAKMGVLGFTQSLALELAPNVLVNAIAPGPILPPQGLSNEETRNIKKVTPLGKWGGAIEIAKAVQFLMESEFVTGECIRVDGGRHLL